MHMDDGIAPYTVRYSGDPDFRGCGYAEIKCICGNWADFNLEHWDDDDEEECGEWYQISCSKCHRESDYCIPSHREAVLSFKHAKPKSKFAYEEVDHEECSISASSEGTDDE